MGHPQASFSIIFGLLKTKIGTIDTKKSWLNVHAVSDDQIRTQVSLHNH